MGKYITIKGADFSSVAASVVRRLTIEISITSDGRVTITDPQAIEIYYTTDGTTPSVNSTRYTGIFTVPHGTTVKAISVYVNYTSDVVEKTYATDIINRFNWTNTYAIVADPNSPNYGNSITDGQDPNYQLFCASNYVDISEFNSLVITLITRASPSAAIGLCFYTSKDVSSVISSINRNNSQNGYIEENIEIPSGAKYLRTTFIIEELTNFVCTGI